MTIIRDLINNLILWVKSLFANFTEADAVTTIALFFLIVGLVLSIYGLFALWLFLSPGENSLYIDDEEKSQVRIEALAHGAISLAGGIGLIYMADLVWTGQVF